MNDDVRCMNCRFWHEFYPDEPESNAGHCRKYAPTDKGFPYVARLSWCGEFERKEEEPTE